MKDRPARRAPAPLDPFVRRRFTSALLAFALAAVALLGAFAGGAWDGYAIGLVVAAVGLVAVGGAMLWGLTKLRPRDP